MQDIRGVRKWLDGTVTDQPGPVSYKVLVGEQLWKRHVDQIHQKHLSNKDSKPVISVTYSNDTTDIQLVTPPQAETAEKSTLKPTKPKVAKMITMKMRTQPRQRNLNLKHAIQLDSVKHRSV